MKTDRLRNLPLIAVALIATAGFVHAEEPAQDPSLEANTPAAAPAAPAQPKSDCATVVNLVKSSVEKAPEKAPTIVTEQVTAHPDCSCEIVKTAITAGKLKSTDVARVVEAASTASPEHMRLAAQCALAVAPDALADVQNVLANLDPSAGEAGYSSKDSKGGYSSKDSKDGINDSKGGNGRDIADNTQPSGGNPLDFIAYPGIIPFYGQPPVVNVVPPGGFPATNINP